MPGVSAGYLGPDQMVVFSFPLYSGSRPHCLAFCLHFPLGLKPFAESQHSGLRPYTLPAFSKTFPLGRKNMFFFCFSFSFLITNNHCLPNNWAGACLNADTERNVTMLWGLNTWCHIWEHPHGENDSLGNHRFHLSVCEIGIENFLTPRKVCITLIWSKLHTDKETKTHKKSWGKTPWIFHYSLVYPISIH